jgi:pimeloyl-ACP methyl ester carboxylesterase
VRASSRHERDGLTIPSTDGVTVVVHDLGDPADARDPLLLVHATGFHGYVWQPLARHLRNHHPYAPDLRGHGDATVPRNGDFAWNGFADDVLAVVDAMGLHDVDAIGHSKGGAALLLAEARRPGTFRALYLYEPVVMPPEWTPDDTGANPLAEGALRRRPVFPSRDAAYANFATKPPFSSLDPAALRAYVDHGFEDQPDGSVSLKCMPENESQVYRMGARHKAFDGLHAVTCPVTVARGGFTDFGPAGFAEPIVAALAHGRLEVFEDLGHFGPLEDPAAVATAAERAFARSR